MFKCIVKQGHLMLGLLFLLQCHPKAVRGENSPPCSANETSPPCSANECSYDSLPPILGKAEANFAPQKTCYNDQERVNVTCTGDLRGPPYNLCTAGHWLYLFGPTCEDITMCNKTDVPKHGGIHPDEAFFDLYERIYYSCNDNYSLVGPSEAACESGGVWNPTTVPTCKADCLTPLLDNGSVSPDTPTVRNGEVITFECSKNFTKTGLSVTTCRDGHFDPPELPVCYAQCSRPIIPNSDATSSSPPLHHGELLIVMCNTGYSNWQSQSSTSRCADGELKPDVSLCYDENRPLLPPQRNADTSQCDRPVIPNSDSTSSVPVLHNGDNITVTCDDGYSNGKSKRTTSVCDHGRLDPACPPCYAQCSRPVIPNSDATSPNPDLNHGDVIIVKCNNGYSNGNSPSSSSVCSYGSLSPTVPLCYAQCSRPVITDSDASSPYPFLDHGEALIITCDTGYSNGQSRSMTAVCTDGMINLPLPFCYAQCSRKVIPNSDSSSSSPPIHHGDVLIVTCDEGYAGGQGNSTSSGCSNGIFSPPLPSCYADCKSLTDPDYGEVVIGSNPYSHREVAVFECNENYTLVGNKEIYCYDGLWGKDPPVCMAPCSMPVIPNSDAISPNPHVPHGTAITVTCNDGYTNGDTARTTIICNDGTISPDETKCIETKMESQDVAAIVLGVLGAAGTFVAFIVGLIWKKCKKDNGYVKALLRVVVELVENREQLRDNMEELQPQPASHHNHPDNGEAVQAFEQHHRFGDRN